MRVLIAGTGSIGKRHIQSLQSLGYGSDIILLRRDGRQDDLSRDLKAPVFSSLMDALAEQPDFVVIATPSAFHTEIVLGCLSENVPFYLEKPAVSSLTDVKRIRDSNTQNTIALVGCNLRFLPSLQRMQTAVREGAIGTVVRADLQAGQWLPDWRPDQDYRESYSAHAKKGGGVLLDLIHEIDMARALFGEFDELSSQVKSVEALGISSEAVSTNLLRNSQGGPLVTVSLDYVSRNPLRSYRAVGMEGTLEWNLITQALILSQKGKEVQLCDLSQDFDVPSTYLLAMDNMVKSVQKIESPLVSLSDGLASTELALRLKEAACLPL